MWSEPSSLLDLFPKMLRPVLIADFLLVMKFYVYIWVFL